MTTSADRRDIAIIGLGVRLPGADSLDAFWEHLAAGRSLISEVPARRWDKDAWHGNPAKGNKTSSIWGGFVAEADCFDAAFFNISPREAAWMDPQQRFALELAWQAIEDAGYRASSLAGSNTGVFMGVCHWDYAELLEKHLAQLDAYTPTGIAFSIIANRVSHFFDLRGPSIANDTACAASLTSVYEAVRALQSGACDLALAGGVNLIWSPNHFVAFAKNGMLSPSGASQAFDQGADGYVRGEGGAMLLLKPLARAVADGDPIHGVIRGIGINHGGRTNSLTVTNPQAQAELVAGVIREAGVAPGSISYIEAHGTGTPLGDPIEIAGLKQAFASLYAAAGETPVPGHCGVGSVKTNIGHLEGAAGVAGIVKVLAALGHEALPGNVNFRELNSLIQLDGTPFHIQGELTPWPRTPDHPRRAGISAFGFGGSNAHAVLEEAPLPLVLPVASAPCLIVLSARDETRLLALARGLLEFLERAGQAISLPELAWTLQDGREAMAAKALWWVEDATALTAALGDFIAAGAAPVPEIPTPLQQLTARWQAGETVDWRELYPNGTPRRIHAPTYRFARERHWMDSALGGKDPEPVVHPLLQRNLSQIGRQHYQSRFTGSEFFWAEHHVGSQQVLPGVVCLEMARAAWALATGQEGDAAVACRIEQMLWARPVLAGEAPVKVGIRLMSGDANQLLFEIERLDTAGGGVNAQGRISGVLPALVDILDLASLRAASAPMAADQLYARLAATGMHHGPSFRAVQALHLGDGYLLASLKLPRQLRGTLDSFVLHPMLLDGAIQAWIGLESEAGLPGPAVPFSCRQIDILGPCSDTMWALLKPIGSQDGGLRRFDITLTDKTGRVSLRFHELALRVMAQGSAALPIYSSPQWEVRPLPESPTLGQTRTRVLLAGFSSAVADQLRAATGLAVDVLPETPEPGRCAQRWFDILREQWQTTRGSGSPQQWLIVLPAGHAALPGAAVAALLRCVTTEQPKFFGAVLSLAEELTSDQRAVILLAEAGRLDRFTEIRYDAAAVRHVARPLAVELPAGPAVLPDANGVVLITGGQGGLGQHFAAWLVARGVGHVVLAGRAAELPGLAAPGVIYRRCDVADADQVVALIRWIEAEVGPLRGIIHAAGVLRDGYLLNKQPADVAAVFAPKVDGVLNLDAATGQAPLDFFLVCSSIAATFGNPGQSDYAAANAFMDAWAAARREQVDRGERSGRTVAMAWPLWADGGMAVDGATRAALQRRFGTVPLPTAVALAALDSALAAGAPSRITLQYGPAERIHQVLAAFGAASEADEALAAPARAEDRRSLALPATELSAADLAARTADWLKDLLGELIQMDPAKIQAHRRLEEYGLDSIVIVEMTNRMEESLGPLSKTLFFEYVDLAGVAGHLAEEKAAALTALFAAGEEMAPVFASEAVAPAAAVVAAEAPDGADAGEHDVAIVGLSLHVAGADDQESFWRMLAQGEHGFRRYPAERWDHEALVHPERDVLGKTVVQTGAFLDGIDLFDPRYFRISQAEAELMSPEVRLFLQTCVEAFEDAGYSRETLQRKYAGDVAVIVGSMTNDYNLYGFQNMLQRGSLASGSYTGTVPNMVSYYYGFTGPSYFLDTMCSAAATCVHEAVHMLRSGRTRMALAGGISLLLHPQKLIATSQEHFTSKTAEVIRGYGLGADGTILGEGVGALVMKRLSDAERDGDHIYGVIKGSGISNAGVRNGFTVPNPRQQAAAIAKALADSGVDPASIGYIEGHGSGTALGDPIEIRALTEVYGKYMGEPQRCAIGTVKSNVAHLLGAAALPGIVKVLLQMQQGKLAPSLHAETLNPNIPFADTPFRVQRQLADWPRRRDAAGGELPRRAGVTSIGAGGVNVHLILEEYRVVPPAPEVTADALFVFSAMNVERLRVLLTRFGAYLEAGPTASLADVAWSLQIGRNELPCRLAVVAGEWSLLRRRLEHFLATGQTVDGLVFTPSILDRDPRVEAGQVADALAHGELARLGAWWCDGVAIPWEQLPGAQLRRRVSLPAYPFERVRCWYQEYPDAPSVVHPLGSSLKLHPFVGANRSDRHGLRYQTPIYLNELLDYVYTENRRPCLLPTVVVEMAAAVACIAGFGEGVALRDLEVGYSPDWSLVGELSAVVLAEGNVPLIELAASEGGAPGRPFARVRIATGGAGTRPGIAVDELRAGAVRSLSGGALYQELAQARLAFLPYLEVVESVWQLEGEGVLLGLRLDHPEQDRFKRNLQFSPAMLGAAWQALLLVRPQFAGFSLSRVAEIALIGGAASQVLVRPVAGSEAWDVLFLDAAGNVVAALQGLCLAAPEQLVWSSAAVTRAAAMPSPARLIRNFEADLPAAPAGTAAPRPDIAAASDTGSVARAAFILGVRELVADMLKFPAADINPRSPFYDLGFDSISLTRLANEINARYGASLTPAIFFECEHIESLAGWLAARQPSPEAAPPLAAPDEAAAVSRHRPVDAVAIVGLAARLPGSADADEFFQHLLQGDDLVGDLPLDRYPPAYRSRLEAAGFPRQGGFLADIDCFDAAFFKTSPHEASRLDPQQRLMLETAWRAVESAGYRPDELPAATGVFVGVSGRDYASLLQDLGVDSDAYVATGNSLAMVANRLSWQFNLHGPSEAVDTACSSSLVALLRAAEAIRAGHCAMALVGGVNLALAIEGFAGPWQAGMLSPSGRCRTFSSAADGYVRGEGVVVLVLKGLAAAERDGDRILGLVAGGAVNHGGRVGALTAPNAKAQAELVQQAMAGIEPASIGYIEAHGTGTSLGDPVEINGLRLAYAGLGAALPRNSIGLGSVKSNIGHLEAAAGLAGVLKVVMAMAARTLPPTLHCASVNPYIELQDSPFYLVHSSQAWRQPVDGDGRRLPRRAGVSSFGFGGSNAHVVLEEYAGQGRTPRRQPLPPRVFAATRYWLSVGRGAAAGPGAESGETVLLVPHWQAQPLPTGGGALVRRRLILPCEFALAVAATPGADLIAVPPLAGTPAARYLTLAGVLLQAVQQAVGAGMDGELLVQLLVPRDAARAVHAGLGAMLDSIGAELPRLLGQVVEVPAEWPAAEALACLEREARTGQHRRVRYQDGGRFVRGWQDFRPTGHPVDWRAGGIYLISGGLGALGSLVAADIARRAPGANLILVGSSPLDPARQAILDGLGRLGAKVHYRQVDISDGAAVATLVDDCLIRHGGLHGVIHCAGIHRDSAFRRKTPAQLQAVLAPKVLGAWALHEACRGGTLDFFVHFSSLASAVGNAGQADYAAANGFLDALAEGQGAPMLAIDWPLWRDGGMKVDAAGEQVFFAQMGQRPLPSEAGLAALRTVIPSGQYQVAVIAGEADRIREFFRQAAELPGAAPTLGGIGLDGDAALRRAVARHLGELLAGVAGLAAAQIEIDEPLEQYGIDSLMITRLNQALGERFGRLSKTLFFEYRTLGQVAGHLLRQHGEACRAWVGLQAEPASAGPAMPRPAIEVAPRSAGTDEAPEPIAIIGLSGRYPGSADVNQFWANLAAGRESIGEIPAERWSLEGFYEADPERAVAEGLSYSRWGGFLDGFADFDPLFFRISPREALAMDPQERLFLMEAWAACEDAGYTRARLADQLNGRVGVFVGVTKTGYALHGVRGGANGSRIRPSTSFASVANRVSFCLDLKGPSLPVDTMCSSSLTAIHEACEHLRRGECDMALAGGVNLYLHPDNYIDLCAARMLSPDGHCRSFGAGGNGFVPGEGVGCIVLKPLSRALADGDQIHGLIRGSAINHGGTTSGYTVPNPVAQGQVVKAALRRAGLDAAAIGYVEAHGTGTELGDPIEFNGLCQAFGELATTATCALGSVKSAIGHLEAAAGIAGLTKVLLQMRHRQLVPTLHVDSVNPNLELAGTPFHLQRQLAPWPAPAGTGQAPRRAGISSFGAGGANAHLVVEEWPRSAAVLEASDGRQAFLLSARHPEALRAVAERLLAFLAEPTARPGPQPALLPVISELLAEQLSVAAADLDPREPLDSYGLEPVHRHALRRALEQRFDIALAAAEVAGWDSIAAIATALAEALPAPSDQANGAARPALADLAWTLQIGREAMECRLAILAATHEELAGRLAAWLQAAPGKNLDGVLSGAASGRRGALGLLADEPDVQGIVGRWLAAGDLDRVLGLWVQGVDVDWRVLPRSRPPRVVSAPTYPFARERYWLPVAAATATPYSNLVGELFTLAAGRAALLAEQDDLENQLAALVRAMLPDLAAVPGAPAWEPWRAALGNLLAGRPTVVAADQASAWAEWTAYRQRVAAAAGPSAQIRLVETVLRALPDILGDRRPATAVMFPDGRMDLVEAVYKQNAVAGRFSACLARAAAAMVAERRAANPAGRLRILEIGAGTGGTSELVLAALAPAAEAIAEYCYTDVSRAFLIHGERHFRAQAPWLRTALFDVEQPLAGQDVVPAGYDLVIAANVLHATRHIDQTLTTVRDLLAPGGVLLVNETSCATLFTHLTFGLLEGWWRFADPQRRIPGSPALMPDSWQGLVAEVGLEWLGRTPDEEHALGQQVWAARRRPGSSAAEAGRPGSAGHAAPSFSLPATPGAAANDLPGLIVDALAATLNLAPTAIDVALSFADYGLDSILGAELVLRLRQRLDVRLTQTDLFDYPNVSQLAVHLEGLGASVGVDAVPEAAGSKAAPLIGADRLKLNLPGEAAGPAVGEPIAIVGYSGRFAGSAGPEALWQHLLAGDDLVRPVSRFDLAPFYRDAEPGSWCQHGSFISDIDRFDARFFNISGLEATYMDPQQRLFLEEAWRTLEHAGHAGADSEGRRCGVFVGCAHGDYQELFRSQPPGQAFWGNTCSLIPARIAYHLNLKGPAVAVDTACSSSLVAVHLACQSLWQGDSDLALAGGVFIQSSSRFYRYGNQAKMLSPSGRCAAFGAGADGIVPGEAVAAVLLRPLSQALADGDTIHGVIVASGINQDGATNGITAPSALSQEQLIREVYQRYGIDPARIGLVEAHGTGTPLGDPIEHAALSRAYRGWTAARGYCALGSIKSNLGHTTTAAGITGLVKVLLALEHQQIPPTLHADEANPALSMADSPFYLNDRPVPWPAQPDRPRQAAISSFGFGGTNAHLVIAEGPVPDAGAAAESAPWLFVLSARSAAQLQSQAAALLAHLKTTSAEPAAIAYTLAVGRRHFAHRLAVVAADRNTLAGRLSAWLAGQSEADTMTAVLPDKREAGVAHSAEPAATGPVRLRLLGQAFLAGDDASPSRQFAVGQGRRVPLPTYPFEGKSYWVSGDAEPPSAPRETVAPPIPPVAQPARMAGSTAKRVVHRLPPAAECAWSEASTTPHQQRPVQLAPLTVPTASPRLHRLADAAGLRSLNIVGPWDDQLLSELAGELAFAAGDPSVHAVFVCGDWWAPLDFIAAPSDLSAPLACPLPVIAAVPAARGAGLALAAHCDFLVLAEAGRYDGRPAMSADSAALLQRRFGQTAVRRLATGAGELAGRELATGLAVVASQEVAAQALALARQIGAAPRLALIELKAHMRQGSQAPQDLPTPPLGGRELAGGPATAEEMATWGRPRRLQLVSPVMAVDLFDDGVAVLHMLERQHKNTFTPAFMAGITEAFARLAEMPECRVLVLTGHDAYFACGGTREGLESLQRGDSRFTDQRIYSLPLDCPLPVIAAMQGHAIGAGWSLGMFCDLALFAADSVYHSNYLRFGFTPGAGATLVFPHRLGDDLGREVLFSASEFKGRELAQRGMPLPVFPAAEVLPRALAVAHRLAGQSRQQLQAAKTAASAVLHGEIEAVLAREMAMHEKTFIGNPLVMERIASSFAAAPTTIAAAPASSGARAGLRQQLVETLAEELLLAPGEIADGDGFLELGLDSILAVTWIRKLNARLGIELPATCVYAQPTVGALLAEVTRLLGAPAAPAIQAPTAPVGPTRPALRRELVETLAEELLMAPDEIGDAAGFLELGLDSILAVTWIRKLNARLGIELPATCVYAQPTVGALLQEVLRLMPVAPAAIAEPLAITPAESALEAVAAPIPAVRAAAESGLTEAIAIVGAAGRFPKAADLAAFWANIRDGRDCIDEIPASRWDIEAYYDPDPQVPGKSYSKWMGAIDDIDLFDAPFFNITAREAELMDPQQRLFLQQAWLAIEDAAIDPADLAGTRCGVFVGSGNSGYGEAIHETNAYSLIGSAGSILAARIAYLLDLRGPCIALDTACSTSLVAIAQACDSLLLGNTDLALAGGACVLLGPRMHIDTSKVGMLSPDGRCYSFDQRANGFVPGEGVGVVLLKRLADAERDGDPIRAVIRGWGSNQDGHTNGITAPNPLAQGALLSQVYRRFAIPPASIGLVETHGTGTSLGDPIEIEGLRAGFGPVPPGTSVAIGSVKSNVGHLLAAAGVAGAIKAMLALEHGELPPSIHFERQNEHLALAGSPFRVQTRPAPWPAPAGAPRRAAVSAFGFSGTNAHLVLEEYRPSVSPTMGGAVPPGPLLCILSARSRAQLAALAAGLVSHLAAAPGTNLADLCWTLQRGRRAFECRAACLFLGRDELLGQLRALAAGQSVSGLSASGATPGDRMLFDDDGDARELLGKWLAAGRLDRLAQVWVQGVTIDWRQSAGANCRRLRLPGYPFARERHWLKADAVASAGQPGRTFVVREEGGAFRCTVRGDEACLSHQTVGGVHLLPGLFLPELARAAGELAGARPVQGLRHMVWGRPLSIGVTPRQLTVAVQPAGDSASYRVAAVGDDDRVCQVGELLWAADADVVWPTLPAAAPLSDATAEFRQARPAARGILAVGRGAGVVRAIWSRPPGDSAMAFDPLLLDAAWQLLAFVEQEAGLPGPRFPLALESLRVAGGVPDEGTLWVWRRAANSPGLTVVLVDDAGKSCLWLEGAVSEQLDALAELHFEREVTQ